MFFVLLLILEILKTKLYKSKKPYSIDVELESKWFLYWI